MTKSTDTDPNELRAYAFKLRRNNPGSWSHKASADTLDDCALRIEQAEAKIEALRKVLDQLQNGVLLDAFNHDDNGLPVLAQRSNDSYIKAQLQKFERLIDTALAARPGEKP